MCETTVKKEDTDLNKGKSVWEGLEGGKGKGK